MPRYGRREERTSARVADEVVLAALLYRLREGCSWRALSIFAPHTTLYTHWREWCDQGVWDFALEAVADRAGGKLWAIDSTSVKVHKHGTGGVGESGRQAIGATRGGRNTKFHALVDGKGRPVRVLLSAGHRNEMTAAPTLVEGQTGRTVLADKSYASAAFRARLEQLGLRACIPPKSNPR